MPKSFFNLLIHSNTLFEMSSADLESTASCHHFGILRKLRLPWTTKGRWVEGERARVVGQLCCPLPGWCDDLSRRACGDRRPKFLVTPSRGLLHVVNISSEGFLCPFGLATWVKGEREACVVSLILCLSEEVCVVLWAESLAQVGTVEWVLPAGWRGTPLEGRCSGPHQWL